MLFNDKNLVFNDEIQFDCKWDYHRFKEIFETCKFNSKYTMFNRTNTYDTTFIKKPILGTLDTNIVFIIKTLNLLKQFQKQELFGIDTTINFNYVDSEMKLIYFKGLYEFIFGKPVEDITLKSTIDFDEYKEGKEFIFLYRPSERIKNLIALKKNNVTLAKKHFFIIESRNN